MRLPTSAPHHKELELVYHLPPLIDGKTRILVLFGGKNWKGDQTLKRFGLIPWADEMNVALVSPSFRDDDYWEPEAWSGEALDRALAMFVRQHGLRNHRLLYYGFSAGGQCVALFYNYQPKRVEAWGVHACGVFPNIPVCHGAPALVTCGTGDYERWQISRNFLFRYREKGGCALWKSYSFGHQLDDRVLEMAKAFFTAILKKERVQFVGDDDSGVVRPVSECRDIHEEYRSIIPNRDILTLWKSDDA